ncbi:MAG: hypothetical protein ACK4OO_05440 [bacterium]
MSLTYNLFACSGDKIHTAQGNTQESQQIVPAVKISGDNTSGTETGEVHRNNSCPFEGTALCPFKSSNKAQTATSSTENIQDNEKGCCSFKKDASTAKSVSPNPASQSVKKES